MDDLLLINNYYYMNTIYKIGGVKTKKSTNALGKQGVLNALS